MDSVVTGEVMPYVTPTQLAYPVPPTAQVQTPAPLTTITLNGMECVITPAGVIPVGQTKKEWTRNPWIIGPAAVVSLACVATLVIVMVAALLAVVHAAIANAFAIGVALLAMVGVALLFILAVGRMRHGHAGSSQHPQHYR